MNIIGPISLTEEERELFENISFTDKSHGVLPTSCENAGKLMSLLIVRDAVPKIRMQYFTDARYNVGGHGKSREEEFEANGTSGTDILYHGSFLPYLRYFICGPLLPAKVLAEICDSDGLEDYPSLARSLVRKHRLDPRESSEEFYKLFIECDEIDSYARDVRDAVKRMR